METIQKACCTFIKAAMGQLASDSNHVNGSFWLWVRNVFADADVLFNEGHLVMPASTGQKSL